MATRKSTELSKAVLDAFEVIKAGEFGSTVLAKTVTLLEAALTSRARPPHEAVRVAELASTRLNLAQVVLWRAWIEMEADRSLSGRNIEPLHMSLTVFELCGMLSGWACAIHALGHALALCGNTETAVKYLGLARTSFRQWAMPWHEIRTDNSLLLIPA